MTPQKIEQCKTEIRLVANVLLGILAEMDTENPYICVSANYSEKTGAFWSISVHGNGKYVIRVDDEGIDGIFEEVCGNV